MIIGGMLRNKLITFPCRLKFLYYHHFLFLQSTQTLSSVVLFDTLVSGFKICDPYLENSATKKKTKLQDNERAQQGVGLRFEQEFGKNETILVKVYMYS